MGEPRPKDPLNTLSERLAWHLVAFIERVLHAGKLEFREEGPIRVGLDERGSSIAIGGRFLALLMPQPIEKLELILAGGNDDERLVFAPRSFRRLYPPADGAGAPEAGPEIRRVAFVSVTEPEWCLIEFRQPEAAARIKRVTEEVGKLAKSALEEAMGAQPPLAEVPLAQLEAHRRDMERLVAMAYRSFTKGPYFRAAVDEVAALCALKSGRYELEMRAAVNPFGTAFSWKWRLRLTDDDCDRLIANAREIVSFACGGPKGPLETVNVDCRALQDRKRRE